MERILIVDDDPAVRHVVAAVLSGEGYDVVSRPDGREGQEFLEKEGGTVNAVVLGWQMPRMTGLELLHWIKTHPALDSTPVIMQTSMRAAEQVKEGIDAGAFYYLTKPMQEKVLLSIVRAALADARYKASLLQQLRQCQNPLGLMVEGTFHFRTPQEGDRLSVILANATPVPQRAMGINEILINAVEHGNLGITYEEKTVYLENGSWASEVERRLALPENAGKKVAVRAAKHEDRMEVVVEDEGPGFDYAKYLHFDESRVFDTHGRGIALAGAVLCLEYLGDGSRVRVTVPFEPLREHA